jgi:2-keto-4-pentenoate hydratase
MPKVDELADALVTAHKSGLRHAPEGPTLTTIAEAYAVQAKIVRALGGVGGFKTGPASGEAPPMAPIPAPMTFASGARVAMIDRIALELEVGWKITAPLPALGAVDFDVALMRAVRPVPVIELAATRLTGPFADDPLLKTADLQLNHALIVGAPLSDWDGDDFQTVTARLSANGADILNGEARVPGGSALGTLRGFVQHVEMHCGGLQVGQVVITGSLAPAEWICAAAKVHGKIIGLGDVHLTLE